MDKDGVETTVRIPALSVEKLVECRMKEYLFEHRKRIKGILPIWTLRRGLQKYVELNQIENGNHLWKLVNGKYIVNSSEIPEKVVPRAASFIRGKLYDSYTKYKDEKLEKDQLPMEKDDYMRKRARYWVVRHCHVMETKNQFENGGDCK